MPIKFNVNSTNYNTPIMTEFLRGLLRAERPNFPSLRESARMSGQKRNHCASIKIYVLAYGSHVRRGLGRSALNNPHL